MDLKLSDEQRAFRDEVRSFFKENLPEDIHEAMIDSGHPSKEQMQRWTKILAEKGWGAPHWPEKYGGTGWGPVQQYIFLEELQAFPAPAPLPFGVNMVGPVIYTFGNEEQKQTYLPRILDLTDWWCQGFSEPGAGSDLASLKTRAVKEGDHYIVNGQKTWTTLAQHADWIFCLVRTDPDADKPQKGISFLLIDMKTEGITVRPIQTVDGGKEVNEVFFDDVKVPVENLVGEENKGWDYAKFLLGNERTNIARIGMSKHAARRIRELAGIELAGGRPLIEDRRFAEKLSSLEVELKALEITQMRVVADDAKNPNAKTPNPASSILKIKGSEIQQRCTDLLMEVMGPYAAPRQHDDYLGHNEPPIGPDYAAHTAPNYFNYRKVSIYGGSNEIQKNIIAKAVLGF